MPDCIFCVIDGCVEFPLESGRNLTFEVKDEKGRTGSIPICPYHLEDMARINLLTGQKGKLQLVSAL